MHLAWFLLLLPLLSAAVIHFGLKKNAFLSSMVSTGSAGATLLLTLFLLNKEGAVSFHWASFGDFHLDIGILLDAMSTRMMLVVTGVGTLVHVFSLVYMADDKAKARYFCGLSLFMFSMTGIVLADNFIMMFIFWELVGLSSYLLIGHWYTKASAADAAKKAFCVNRIGDFGFMVGILLLWILAGSLTFSEMHLSEGLSAGILGAALLCVFCGAVGKSAQAPLHVWLPDAMEGPTPVSALIHAATMVAAGVYMMARVFLSLGDHGTLPFPQWSTDTIAWIGGITSLLAALMATQQSDIKKILAYSTLSQLGYMVLVLGIAHGHSTEASMFHLYTHAWFKALLFLGSGAIIYACHHEQDIWKMGGLAKKMPITTITFATGTLALAGFPFTAGFFSKEQVLHAAEHNMALFVLVAVVAVLTTFYMGRLFFIVFLGKPRSENAEKAKEVGPLMFVPLVILAVLAVVSGQKVVAEVISPLYYHVPLKFGLALYTSLGAFAVGAALAFVFYFNKTKDPLANNPISKLFANRFYIDEFYDQVVKYAVNIKAATIDFLDEFIINGLLVGGLARCSAAIGQLFNRAQSGSLQTYSLLMGVGIVLVIYLTVFVK